MTLDVFVRFKELLKLAWDAGSEECLDIYYGRDTETFQEWYTKQKLNIHGVMQAEGSDGVLGAPVASEGQEEANMCAECSYTYREKYDCLVCDVCGRKKHI